MSKRRLLIVGAGGHGRVVADAAELAGDWARIAFVDDKYPGIKTAGSWSIIGSLPDLEWLRDEWDAAVVAVGDNLTRLKIQKKIHCSGLVMATIIHPSAQVAKYVEIGEGSVIFANAVINTGSKLGKSVIVNTSATIDHDGVVGDGAHISPGAHLAGNVIVDDCAWIGVGASVINNLVIGMGAVVGAGATVISDVAESNTVVGVPAKPISL